MNKVQDIMTLAQEMLSADVMLPNLVAVINEEMEVRKPSPSNNGYEITYKVIALESMQTLID